MRTLTLLSILFISLNSISQITLFEENFENSPAISFFDDLTTNEWRVLQCAGNGPSQPGSTSLYVTAAGAIAGCSSGGMDAYEFDNSPAGTIMTSASLGLIDLSCATTVSLSLDYQYSADGISDYAEILYSTDAITWNVLSSLAPSATWTNFSTPISPAISANPIYIAFRFHFDDINNTGTPLAVDNVVITGIDNVAPNLSCLPSDVLVMSANCTAIVDDYDKTAILASDNCTDSIDLVFVQNPLPGTILAGNVGDILSVELYILDEAGNQSTSCMVSVEIIDDTPPVVNYCPTDTIAYLNASCELHLADYLTGITGTDNCSSMILYSQSPVAGTVFSGTTIIPATILMEDESGNIAQCDFDIDVVDTLNPTVICPTNQTIYATAACNATLPDYTNLAIAADNCTPSGSLVITQFPAPSTVIFADQIITMQVTGGEQCTFNAFFIDTISPAISCPLIPTQFSNASCEATIGNYIGSIIWSDNCESSIANMTVVQIPSSGTNVQNTTVIEIEITDPSGNSTSCFTNFNVVDTIKPIVTCPSDLDVSADINCQTDLIDYSISVTATDNCTTIGNLIYSQNPIVGTTISAPTLVTMTVEDESGNTQSCQFTVTVVDVTDPSLMCPPNTTVSSNASCDYSLTDLSSLVTVSDNCTVGTDFLFSQIPIVGTNLALGSTNVDFTVADEAGNQAMCTIEVIVVDDISPIFSACPTSGNAFSDANCEALIGDYSGDVVYSDNCSSFGNITFSQNPTMGTVITTNQAVTITITDEAGNDETCVFNVTIADTTNPVINCPADETLATNATCDYTIPNYGAMVTGSDNCSAFGDMGLIQSPIPGATGNGITAVQITLTDEQGNSSVCTTTITPIDNTAPSINCPATITVNNGTNCDFVLPNYVGLASVTDNCSGFVINQSPAVGSIVNTGTSSITLTVTDAGGNVADCSFDIEIIETQAPSITCPANISTCDPIVTYVDPTFNDNCLVSLSQTDNTGFTSGDMFPVGTTILEYTATDSSGNETSCTFFVEILDYPSDATILDDTIALCGQNTVLIEAQANTSGTGMWSLESGQGNFNNEFANVTGVNNLGVGNNVFVWTVSSVSCGSNSDTLLVINSLEPSEANTQDTLIACSQNQVNLLTATPSSGTGMWSTPQGGTIGNPNLPTTIAFNMPFGWNEFIWTISTPGCPSKSDTMHVFRSGNIHIFEADTSICFADQTPINLSGTPIDASQTALWEVVAGFGIFTNTNESTTTVSNLDLGINTIVYKVTHPICPTDTDTIRINMTLCDGFEPTFPTVITPNNDGKNDVFVIQNLQKIYPDCHVVIFNRWGSVVFESFGYEIPWNGTFNGEKLPMGTYFFKIELNDEENNVFNGPISIIH